MDKTISNREIQEARDLIEAANRITVLTGAGISTDSGIPDFRGPNGVWTRDPEAEKLSTIGHYLNNEAVREASWQVLLNHNYEGIEANIGHVSLRHYYARTGKIDKVITQNVDGLHQQGNTYFEPLMIELHGNDQNVVCTGVDGREDMALKDCNLRVSTQWVLRFVEAGVSDPRCPRCGSILKRDVVYFGENLDDSKWTAAVLSVAMSDLLLVVGTSLTVYPAAELIHHATGANQKILIINQERTEGDRYAALKIEGPISEALVRVLSE